MSQRDIGWIDYIHDHWGGYVALASIAAAVGFVGSLLKFGSSSQEIAYSVAAGIVGLLAFQVITDYKNAQFVSRVLDQHQLSFHIGARLYENHHDVLPRESAVRAFLKNKDEIRLLTSTADDYVLQDKEAYSAICEKLGKGAHMRILLFTPIYNLRSYLDSHVASMSGSDSNGDEDRFHGQRHRHASELVYDQLNLIIPAIDELSRSFSGQIEVKFFHIKHHVNLIIYGNRRIFAAPFLVGTAGRELPCLEVFPGLTSSGLFEKLSMEFEYIWKKESITFSLSEMKEIYAYIGDQFPTYFRDRWIDPGEANKIEAYAREIVSNRAMAAHALNPQPSN